MSLCVLSDGDTHVSVQVWYSNFLVSRTPWSPLTKRWLPVAIGLSAIPAIIHPIDDFVESMMNRSVRKLTKFTPRIPHQFST